MTHAAGSSRQAAHAGGSGAYIWAWIALMALSTLTLWLSFMPLGAFEVAVGLSIAAVKATVIALVFMHLNEQRVANAYVLVAALILVAFFISLAAAEVGTRPHPPGPAAATATTGT